MDRSRPSPSSPRLPVCGLVQSDLPIRPDWTEPYRGPGSSGLVESLVPRSLRLDLHSSLCLHTAADPTWPLSERDPSGHHIQTPTPTLATLSVALYCTAHLAAVLSSRMQVLTTDSSARAGQLMASVVWLFSCSFLTTLYIGAPEEGFWCRFLTLLLHAFASLAANRC